jgi:hypothetical protein
MIRLAIRIAKICRMNCNSHDGMTNDGVSTAEAELEMANVADAILKYSVPDD